MIFDKTKYDKSISQEKYKFELKQKDKLISIQEKDISFLKSEINDLKNEINCSQKEKS